MRQITTGEIVSVISIGMQRTRLGKAVADMPSWRGRAPVPPAMMPITVKRVMSVRCWVPGAMPGPPNSGMPHRLAAPSAGVPPPSAWCRQPNITSGSIWPTAWRAVTALGRGACRIEPSGALTVTVASEPALFRIAGPTMQRTPNAV